MRWWRCSSIVCSTQLKKIQQSTQRRLQSRREQQNARHILVKHAHIQSTPLRLAFWNKTLRRATIHSAPLRVAFRKRLMDNALPHTMHHSKTLNAHPHQNLCATGDIIMRPLLCLIWYCSIDFVVYPCPLISYFEFGGVELQKRILRDPLSTVQLRSIRAHHIRGSYWIEVHRDWCLKIEKKYKIF